MKTTILPHEFRPREELQPMKKGRFDPPGPGMVEDKDDPTIQRPNAPEATTQGNPPMKTSIPPRNLMREIQQARDAGIVPGALLAPLMLGGTPEEDFGRLVQAIEQAKALVRETGKPHNLIKTANNRIWTLPVPPFGEEELLCTVTVTDAEKTQ